MFRTKSDLGLALSLVFAVFLWGANNAGTRFIVGTWPPIWTGGTRFACAGLIMLALLRWTRWLGEAKPLTPQINRQLWLKGGLSLAVYIVCFNWALRFTTASHVALYLGASPVWALLWEGKPTKSWQSLQRYGAAMLALTGVFVLFWPVLKSSSIHGGTQIIGEILGIAVSVLWTTYGRQCRALGAHLSGIEVSAHTMWRAGLMLLVIGVVEAFRYGVVWRMDLVLIQLYCIVAGGVVAFAIWNHALRRWPTSQVLLFNNLIPLSTTTWAHFCLKEPLTPTFWIAMILIVSGVILGQTNWQKILQPDAVPPE
ncbi:MAG TPA: DMT family transporter [Candidatus Paceibacterota bacterium]|nr:DMT family transporter [Candidatus Paceibacterota bacterium]